MSKLEEAARKKAMMLYERTKAPKIIAPADFVEGVKYALANLPRCETCTYLRDREPDGTISGDTFCIKDIWNSQLSIARFGCSLHSELQDLEEK